MLSYEPQKRLEGEELAKALSKVGKIGRDTKKIDLGLGYAALIIPYNSFHKVYVRYGANANSGNDQQEIILIDKDGNIDESTPLLLDYEKVTRIDIIRCDLEPLTVENGEFLTRSSRVNVKRMQADGTVKKSGAYFHRGIVVSRSNTTLKNVNHYIEGEITVEEQAAGIDGPPYEGFFNPQKANNVTLLNCVMTARRYYVPGTYGFTAQHVNNIVLKGCKQSNFYKADGKTLSMEISPITGKLEYWGIGGTSFCKNMIYEDCFISRYDAHRGLYNGRIKNCYVTMVNLVGGGDMIIENTTFEQRDRTIINLREDYGSTWRGNILLKDCTVIPSDTERFSKDLYVIGERWVNHDFGYPCFVPNVTVDNIHITKERDFQFFNIDDNNKEPIKTVFTEKNLHLDTLSDGTENKNKLTPPEYLRVINNKSGHSIKLVDVPIFENTAVDGIEQ